MEDKEVLEILRKHITICEDKMCLRSPNTARIQVSIYNCSDYSDFKYEIKDLAKLNNRWGFPPFSIDCQECNVVRYFTREDIYKFRVGKELSDFDITLVEV